MGILYQPKNDIDNYIECREFSVIIGSGIIYSYESGLIEVNNDNIDKLEELIKLAQKHRR